MSRRSMIRARIRRLAAAQRRRRAAVGLAAAAGAAAALAPSAQGAAFQVTNLGDASPPAPCDATCSLREAVTAANADAAADTITFSPQLAGLIRLTAGPLPIQAALTIEGPGRDVISISGDANDDDVHDAGDSRIFFINPDTVGADFDPVSISGLTIEEGFAVAGGGILTDSATLTIDDVTIRDNQGPNAGGGIFHGYGGTLTITDSTFRGNAAPGGGGEGGALIVGGEIGLDTDDDLLIRDSTFTGNAAGSDGGAIYFGRGSDSARIERTTLNGNQAAAQGGAIFIDGPDTGLGPVTIEDTTVTGNTAGNDGGGIFAYNYGDGLVAIRNSTVAGNSAVDLGGGIFRSGLEITVPGTDNVELASTIVAGNTAGTGPDLGQNPAATGAFTGGFNLIGDPSGGASIFATPAGSDLIGADPQLASLADNGGPTRTMLPAATSPAIDAGSAAGLSVDQRGLPRTIDQPPAPDAADGTDIGAVELPDTELSGARVKAKKKQRQTGRDIKVRVTAEAAEAVTVRAQGKVRAKRKRFVLQKFAEATAAGRKARITLNPKKGRANRQINKLLDRRKKVTVTLEVTLTDKFGNEGRESERVRLK